MWKGGDVRVVRWERRVGSKVGKVGGKWGDKVGEWWGGKDGRFLVLFKSGGRRVSSRFHLFVYDVRQGTKGGMGSSFSCVAAGMERTSLDLPHAVNNGWYVSCFCFIIYYMCGSGPNLLKELGGHLELTDDWARHLLKSLTRREILLSVWNFKSCIKAWYSSLFGS